MPKLSNLQLSGLELPGGWSWVQRPTLMRKGSFKRAVEGVETWQTLEEGFAELHKWAVEHRIGVTAQSAVVYRFPQFGSIYVYTTFAVEANVTVSRAKASFGPHTCEGCGEMYDNTKIVCPRCRWFSRCGQCGYSGHSVQAVQLGGKHAGYYCVKDAKVCSKSGCSNFVHPRARSAQCDECSPTQTCVSCGSGFDVTAMTNVAGPKPGSKKQFVCKACYEANQCAECKTYTAPARLQNVSGRKLCAVCVDIEADKIRKPLEKFPPEEIPIGGSLVIPSLPERPVRLVSIETEVNGDGPFLARTLWRCGLVPYDRVAGYSEHPQATQSEYPSFLKYDGSVTAGELITYLLDLSDRGHAEALMDVMRKLRSVRAMGKADHPAVAGGHIHIDAHNFTYDDAWRLVTVFNYLEDPIYRLAGAGCDYGHRTLVPGHDAANGGQGYANPIIKGPFGTKSIFGQNLDQMKRMHGLNFTPYLAALKKCDCGAVRFEGGKDCTCNLGKATIEWRVWNSTGVPRILHAWVAFMQAMHSYAQRDEGFTGDSEKEFPGLPWKKEPWGKVTSSKKKKVMDRLIWIHRNLPLTREERDSLNYAFKHSDMRDLGEADLDALMQIDNMHGLEAKKPPRNPNRRERAIKIRVPEPGSTPNDPKLARSVYNDPIRYRVQEG